MIFNTIQSTFGIKPYNNQAIGTAPPLRMARLAAVEISLNSK